MKIRQNESVNDSIRHNDNSYDDNSRITVRLTTKTEAMLSEIKNKTQMPTSSIVRYAITNLHRTIIGDEA